MTVKYEEDWDGVYWVDGSERGESKTNLHHAMKDYERVCSGGATNDHTGARIATGEDGGPGSEFNNSTEEANSGADAQGAGGSEAGGSGADDQDQGAGGSGAEVPNGPEV